MAGYLLDRPHTQHHLLWMRTSLWLLVVHFTCPIISSIPHYCKVFSFHCPSQFVSKTNFSLHLSRESHAEIWARKFFFSLMWNPNIKVMNITELVQMIFNAWNGYFGYVGYFLRGATLIGCSQLILDLISIYFNWSTSPWASEKSPAQNFENHFWYIRSVTAPSHTLHTLFLCFSYVFTFLQIKKHNMSKTLLIFFPLQY